MGKPRYGWYFPPAGFAGLWAAPKAAGAFVVETGGLTEPLLFAEDERQMVFQPGFDCACWDVTTSPRLMWQAEIPFAATGAVFVEGRIVVFNDWRLSALDSRSGDVLWTYRTVRRTPVEFATTAPVRSVVASARRVAFVRDKRLTILDAGTGRVVYRHSFESQSPIDLAAADGVFIILTASGSTGTRLVILDAQAPEGAFSLKAIVEVSPKYAQYARMTVGGGRIYVSSPGQRFVTSVDAAAGQKRWRNNRLPNISRVLKVETLGGKIVSTGVASDRNLSVSIFAEADGKLLASYRCRSFGAAPGDTVYIMDTKMRFCRYRIGRNKPAFQKKLDFGVSWLMPLDWRFVGGNIYMLLGNPGRNISKGLSVARLDAATGRMEGPWGLPVAQANTWSARFEDIAGGRVAVVAGRGVLIGTWEALCGDRMVPFCRAGHLAGAVPIGKAAAAQASAVRLGTVVADGDLADWAGAKWMDIAAPGGPPEARAAFAYDGKRFFVGIQTLAQRSGGSRTGSPRRDFLRLSVDAAASSTAGVPKVDFDMSLASVPGRGVVKIAPVPAGDVAVEARMNHLGGCDCEIAIPWAVLGRKGPDSGGKAVMAAALGGIGGSEAAWSWPRGVPYKPGFFGKVRLEGEAR
ncbi:MAG: PQQ-binding-like beta-propeller repeat protein [Planctomycetes bacterium]|nr:PQQ-binding-like beta-propeller repeat protein [Planctomycetota bacterium]